MKKHVELFGGNDALIEYYFTPKFDNHGKVVLIEDENTKKSDYDYMANTYGMPSEVTIVQKNQPNITLPAMVFTQIAKAMEEIKQLSKVEFVEP